MSINYLEIKQDYARKLRFLVEDINPVNPVLDTIYFSTDEEIRLYEKALKEMKEAILRGEINDKIV